MRYFAAVLSLCAACFAQGGMMPGPGTVHSTGGGHPAVFTGVSHVWTMSEGANVTRVDSVGTSNLLDTNSNTGVTTGLLHSNAASYGGVTNQNLTMASPITLSAASKWSLATWVKTAAATHFLFVSNNGSVARLYQNATVIVAEDSSSNASTAAVTVPADGNWHLVVIVSDTTAPCIATFSCLFAYVDTAASVLQIGFNNTYNGNFTLNTIGDYNAFFGDAWAVGDTFLWGSTALSGANVTTLYNGGAGLAY